MLRHLFHQIHRVFCPKEEPDTNHKYPISLKKLGQGDGSWSTRKTFLVWDLDVIAHLIHLPFRHQEKVTAALAAIPGKLRTTSRCKCSNILWLLRSITLTIAGLKVMFTRVQHALKR